MTVAVFTPDVLPSSTSPGLMGSPGRDSRFDPAAWYHAWYHGYHATPVPCGKQPFRTHAVHCARRPPCDCMTASSPLPSCCQH
jgi:hypothetical protein